MTPSAQSQRCSDTEVVPENASGTLPPPLKKLAALGAELLRGILQLV